MAKLTESNVSKRIKSLKGWHVKDGAIRKTFSFENYYETMAFVNATAFISHREDHHPDLEVGYNKCTMAYSTHSAGGLTLKDFSCAGIIEELMSKK